MVRSARRWKGPAAPSGRNRTASRRWPCPRRSPGRRGRSGCRSAALRSPRSAPGHRCSSIGCFRGPDHRRQKERGRGRMAAPRQKLRIHRRHKGCSQRRKKDSARPHIKRAGKIHQPAKKAPDCGEGEVAPAQVVDQTKADAADRTGEIRKSSQTAEWLPESRLSARQPTAAPPQTGQFPTGYPPGARPECCS